MDPTERNDRARSLGRSLRTLQNNVERAGPAAAASYSLIGSVLLFGGLGYGCDRWLQRAMGSGWRLVVRCGGGVLSVGPSGVAT